MLAFLKPNTLLAAVFLAVTSSGVDAQTSFYKNFTTRLYEGKTSEALVLAEVQISARPHDRQAVFALGSAQFLNAVQNLGRGLYRYGLPPELDGGMSGLPFLRLPVPKNPNPDQVTYAALRNVLSQFVDDLALAEATLAGVGPDKFDFPLDLSRIRLDFDGDGVGSDQETLLYAFAAVSSQAVSTAGYEVDFDQSDAPWLQGYCHLLSALANFLLAHDWHMAFDKTFHSLFPASDFETSALNALDPRTGDYWSFYHSLKNEDGTPPRFDAGDGDYEEWLLTDEGLRRQKMNVLEQGYEKLRWLPPIADLIAFIHLFNWPVVEPERMVAARVNLLEMIALSRENWTRIQAEVDDSREWVPSPTQSGIFERMSVTESIVDSWHLFLDEFEAVLEGRRLIKHWRFFSRGVNVRRMFDEPRTFDPVLIVQGSAVIPYLEEGDMVTGDAAETLLNLFGGGFFAYFIWFN